MATKTKNKSEAAAPSAPSAPSLETRSLLERVEAELAGVTEKGDKLREKLIAVLEKIHAEKPLRVTFSSDKETRKAQMEAGKKTDIEWRKSLVIVRNFAKANGAEITRKVTGSITTAGTVNLRETETVTLKSARKGMCF